METSLEYPFDQKNCNRKAESLIWHVLSRTGLKMVFMSRRFFKFFKMFSNHFYKIVDFNTFPTVYYLQFLELIRYEFLKF